VTRKHFQAVAEAAGRAYARGMTADWDDGAGFRDLTERLEDALEGENPRFDRGRFRDAVLEGLRDEDRRIHKERGRGRTN
jgi:hypothetical protein